MVTSNRMLALRRNWFCNPSNRLGSSRAKRESGARSRQSSSCGGWRRPSALIVRSMALNTSPHPEEPQSGVSKDEGVVYAQTRLPLGSRRGYAAPHHEGLGTPIHPSSRGAARAVAIHRHAAHLIQSWIAARAAHARNDGQWLVITSAPLALYSEERCSGNEPSS